MLRSFPTTIQAHLPLEAHVIKNNCSKPQLILLAIRNMLLRPIWHNNIAIYSEPNGKGNILS